MAGLGQRSSALRWEHHRVSDEHLLFMFSPLLSNYFFCLVIIPFIYDQHYWQKQLRQCLPSQEGDDCEHLNSEDIFPSAADPLELNKRAEQITAKLIHAITAAIQLADAAAAMGERIRREDGLSLVSEVAQNIISRNLSNIT